MAITLPTDQPQVGSGNPVLDELDALSPQAKEAAWQAHQAHLQAASGGVPTESADPALRPALAGIPGGTPPSGMPVPGAQDQPQSAPVLRPTIGTQQTSRMPSMMAQDANQQPATPTSASVASGKYSVRYVRIGKALRALSSVGKLICSAPIPTGVFYAWSLARPIWRCPNTTRCRGA